jgi:hypothetical protein
MAGMIKLVNIERSIVYVLPIISISVEIIRSFIGDENKLMAIRNYGLLLFMIYIIIRYFRMAVQLNYFLIILMFYLLALLLLSESNLEQYNDYVRAMAGKLPLILGFVFTSTYDHLKELNKRLLITMMLFAGSIIIFSILGIGENQYGVQSGFSVGKFTYSSIYVGSYLLIILPLMYFDARSDRWRMIISAVGVITLIILVLSVRRTAIVFVLIGAAVYLFLYRNQIAKIVLRSMVVVIVILLSFPLYQDMLMRQIAARADVFNDNEVTENLRGETRVEETIAVWNERIMNPDLKIMLFGQHLFDSAGKYDDGIHKDRPLHLDLNILLHGAGLIGLVLLMLFYGKIFYTYMLLKTRLNLPQERLITGAFMGIFLSHIFLLFSGGMLNVTFNLISYLYMGAILGLYSNTRRMNRINEMKNLVNAERVEQTNPYVFKTNRVLNLK